MCFFADPEQRIIEQVAVLLQAGDLVQQHFDVEDDTVAYDTELVRMKSAGGDQMKNGFPAIDHQRVAGVVTALKADDDVRITGEEIDDFAFSFVSPLCADDRN